jgi:hypothetical protein
MDIFLVINALLPIRPNSSVPGDMRKGTPSSQVLHHGHTVGSTFRIPARRDYIVSLVCWIPFTRFYAFILYIGKAATPLLSFMS